MSDPPLPQSRHRTHQPHRMHTNRTTTSHRMRQPCRTHQPHPDVADAPDAAADRTGCTDYCVTKGIYICKYL